MSLVHFPPALRCVVHYSDGTNPSIRSSDSDNAPFAYFGLSLFQSLLEDDEVQYLQRHALPDIIHDITMGILSGGYDFRNYNPNKIGGSSTSVPQGSLAQDAASSICGSMYRDVGEGTGREDNTMEYASNSTTLCAAALRHLLLSRIQHSHNYAYVSRLYREVVSAKLFHRDPLEDNVLPAVADYKANFDAFVSGLLNATESVEGLSDYKSLFLIQPCVQRLKKTLDMASDFHQSLRNIHVALHAYGSMKWGVEVTVLDDMVGKCDFHRQAIARWEATLSGDDEMRRIVYPLCTAAQSILLKVKAFPALMRYQIHLQECPHHWNDVFGVEKVVGENGEVMSGPVSPNLTFRDVAARIELYTDVAGLESCVVQMEMTKAQALELQQKAADEARQKEESRAARKKR